MAAVASRASNEPLSHPNSSSMSSPKDVKKSNVKGEDAPRKDSSDTGRPTSSSGLEKADPVQPPEQAASDAESKPSILSTTNGAAPNGKPLGPPPRPAQQNATDTPDYFSQAHGTNQGPYQAEPNPFEAQFGNPSVETPGKGGLLPPLSSLTSPQPLLNGTPGWPSLRSGPLSPAMLAGPAGGNDYFDQGFSRGFPTPNESGLRSGLTPGGGGSMFPAPSPNSQALFNSLQSGAAAQASNFAPTSNPTDPHLQQNMDRSQQQQSQQDSYGQQHADADAVNGLYMLAQANQSSMRNGNQFAVPSQSSALQTNIPAMHSGGQSQDTSPVTKRDAKNSIGSMSISGATDDFSDSGRSEPATKPSTRSRGKKATGRKSAGNRRKAEDTLIKQPAAKRVKGNNGASSSAMLDMMMSDEEDMEPMSELNANGKKMTDEEKRKNFLERNRVAALKCRQRKKQWLANLQAKVELFSTENDALSQTVTQLREELVNLKTIMLAHKDCPISVQQGIAGPAMSMYLGADGSNHHANPYGMGMQPNGLQQNMQMAGAQSQGNMQRS